MSTTGPPSDPELAAEQSYLEHALASLAAMRQRSEELLRDLIAAGNPDLDYVAALSWRTALDLCSSGASTRRTEPPGTSAGATLRTPDRIRWSWTGAPRWRSP